MTFCEWVGHYLKRNILQSGSHLDKRVDPGLYSFLYHCDIGCWWMYVLLGALVQWVFLYIYIQNSRL